MYPPFEPVDAVCVRWVAEFVSATVACGTPEPAWFATVPVNPPVVADWHRAAGGPQKAAASRRITLGAFKLYCSAGDLVAGVVVGN